MQKRQEGKGRERKGKEQEQAVPAWLDTGLWEAFKDHRCNLKKPISEYGEKLLFSKLEKFKERGIDPNACLKETIENGWQGVFEPKGGYWGFL